MAVIIFIFLLHLIDAQKIDSNECVRSCESLSERYDQNICTLGCEPSFKNRNSDPFWRCIHRKCLNNGKGPNITVGRWDCPKTCRESDELSLCDAECNACRHSCTMEQWRSADPEIVSSIAKGTKENYKRFVLSLRNSIVDCVMRCEKCQIQCHKNLKNSINQEKCCHGCCTRFSSSQRNQYFAPIAECVKDNDCLNSPNDNAFENCGNKCDKIEENFVNRVPNCESNACISLQKHCDRFQFAYHRHVCHALAADYAKESFESCLKKECSKEIMNIIQLNLNVPFGDDLLFVSWKCLRECEKYNHWKNYLTKPNATHDKDNATDDDLIMKLPEPNQPDDEEIGDSKDGKLDPFATLEHEIAKAMNQRTHWKEIKDFLIPKLQPIKIKHPLKGAKMPIKLPILPKSKNRLTTMVNEISTEKYADRATITTCKTTIIKDTNKPENEDISLMINLAVTTYKISTLTLKPITCKISKVFRRKIQKSTTIGTATIVNNEMLMALQLTTMTTCKSTLKPAESVSENELTTTTCKTPTVFRKKKQKSKTCAMTTTLRTTVKPEEGDSEELIEGNAGVTDTELATTACKVNTTIAKLKTTESTKENDNETELSTTTCKTSTVFRRKNQKNITISTSTIDDNEMLMASQLTATTTCKTTTTTCKSTVKPAESTSDDESETQLTTTTCKTSTVFQKKKQKSTCETTTTSKTTVNPKENTEELIDGNLQVTDIELRTTTTCKITTTACRSTGKPEKNTVKDEEDSTLMVSQLKTTTVKTEDTEDITEVMETRLTTTICKITVNPEKSTIDDENTPLMISHLTTTCKPSTTTCRTTVKPVTSTDEDEENTSLMLSQLTKTTTCKPTATTYRTTVKSEETEELVEGDEQLKERQLATTTTCKTITTTCKPTVKPVTSTDDNENTSLMISQLTTTCKSTITSCKTTVKPKISTVEDEENAPLMISQLTTTCKSSTTTVKSDETEESTDLVKKDKQLATTTTCKSTVKPVTSTDEDEENTSLMIIHLTKTTTCKSTTTTCRTTVKSDETEESTDLVKEHKQLATTTTSKTTICITTVKSKKYIVEDEENASLMTSQLTTTCKLTTTTCRTTVKPEETEELVERDEQLKETQLAIKTTCKSITTTCKPTVKPVTSTEDDNENTSLMISQLTTTCKPTTTTCRTTVKSDETEESTNLVKSDKQLATTTCKISTTNGNERIGESGNNKTEGNAKNSESIAETLPKPLKEPKILNYGKKRG